MTDKEESLKLIKGKMTDITAKMEKDCANLELFGDYVFYKTAKSYDSASHRLHVLRYIYEAISNYDI